MRTLLEHIKSNMRSMIAVVFALSSLAGLWLTLTHLSTFDATDIVDAASLTEESGETANNDERRYLDVFPTYVAPRRSVTAETTRASTQTGRITGSLPNKQGLSYFIEVGQSEYYFEHIDDYDETNTWQLQRKEDGTLTLRGIQGNAIPLQAGDTTGSNPFLDTTEVSADAELQLPTDNSSERSEDQIVTRTDQLRYLRERRARERERER